MTISSNILHYVEGDTLPYMQGTLTNDDGSPVDLTDMNVTLHIGYNPPLVKIATITDALNGKFFLEWDPTDLVAGRWKYEIQIANAAGGIRTINRLPDTSNLILLIDPQIA